MSVNRNAESRRWFLQVSYHLKAARGNIDGGFYDTARFPAQQAAEKALKSLLHYLGARREALLTHSLAEMVRASEKKAHSALNLMDEAPELDLHYVPS